MAYIFDLVDTWASGGGPYTSIKMNATDNDTASASLLMDLQVGGASRLSVAKTGTISSAATGAAASVVSAANFKIYSNTYFAVESGGGVAMTLERGASTGLRVGSTMPIGWSSTIDAWNNAPDVLLTRKAAANLRFGAADVGATTATVTITIATPGVVTWSGHTLSTGTPVVFTTTGALPTGITSGTTYYAVVVDANTFQLASSVANAIAATPTVITTSGSQSGTHTGTRYNITQRLSMQSVTGVTDRLGADLIITGSQGTGTGAGGSIIFQVAPAGSSGSAQNALVNALRIVSTSANTTSFEFWQPAVGGVPPRTVEIITCDNIGTRIGGIISNANTGEVRFGAFTAGGYYTTFYSNNAERWQINTSGHFLASADNTYDIGAFNASRPRYGYFGSGVAIYGASAGVMMQQGGDGILRLLNYLNNDFNRLQFGGTTSSFPALKRNGTALETKLADDTAYAPHAMQYLDVTDGVTAPASATGRARIYVDTADGDLKVIFADGTVKTIVTDT